MLFQGGRLVDVENLEHCVKYLNKENKENMGNTFVS